MQAQSLENSIFIQVDRCDHLFSLDANLGVKMQAWSLGDLTFHHVDRWSRMILLDARLVV